MQDICRGGVIWRWIWWPLRFVANNVAKSHILYGQFITPPCAITMPSKLIVQNIQCGVSCVARKVILLKPHIVSVQIIQFRSKTSYLALGSALKSLVVSVFEIRQFCLLKMNFRWKSAPRILSKQNTRFYKTILLFIHTHIHNWP